MQLKKRISGHHISKV